MQRLFPDPGLADPRRIRFLRWLMLMVAAGMVAWAATGATVQSVLFSDSFSGTLSQWTTPGAATISNGQLQLPKSLDMIRASADPTAWSDYHLTANVTISAVAVGVMFRSPDVNDGYMWQLSVSAQQVRLHKKVGGTYTVLKQTAYPFAANTAYAVEIATSGTTMAIWINGTLVDTTTDSTFSQGVVGFRTGSTETGIADDVVVYTTTDPIPTPTPAPTPTPTPTPTPAVTPGTPTGFQASVQWNAGSPLAVLKWTASATGTPTGFLLERRVTGTTIYQRLTGLSASALAFSDYWIQPNTSYDYRLSAFNAVGTSGYAALTFPASVSVPLGYVIWAQSLWPATGGSLAAGSLWTDTGTDGVANSFKYAFSSNPVLGGAPGGLSIQRAGTNALQLWGNSFAARIDTHYQLQGSLDFGSWQTYLDETSSLFPAISGGAGTSAGLLNINPAAASGPRFFRWSVSPNPSASVAPAGLLVNGLSGGTGATLTQNTPAFSWAVGSDSQTGYEILVATSASLLGVGTADVWDSGKVTGTGSLSIPFAGLALKSNTTYYWTVRTWNSAGVASAFTTAQTFTTGTLTTTYQTDRPKVVQESIAPVNVVQKGTGWYFIDFGSDSWGTLKINVPSPVAAQVITVGMGEELSDATTVDTTPDGYVRYQSLSVTLKSGTTSYAVTPATPTGTTISPPSYIGSIMPFRYVEIKNVPEPFTASQISQLAVHVPFNDAAATFTSSDALLNSVWDLCKHTAKATTAFGVYVDGDRERKPYEADAYISMLNAYCVDRDYATPRYTHEYLLTHSTWPTEWLSHSIFMAWMDYLYTGDVRSLQANYTTLQAKLMPTRIRSDGLYTGSTSSGSGSQPTDIVDWPATERDSYTMTQPVKTVTSAFRYQALVYMQQIATVLGKTSDASGYQTAATLTLNSLNSKLWDATNNRYLDGMASTDTAGTVGAHASLHANLYPLVFGMVPADRQASVVSYIESRGMLCSVYGAQYLFEALYGAGEGTYALSLLDSTGIRSWYNMIAEGSTMTTEAWDLTLKTNEDWNHAWGAAAANIIPRWLMGVRPLTPGFGKILIQPQPGSLQYASITVPTIRGTVSVTVQENTSAAFSLSVNIPANATAKVGLPTLSSTSTAVSVDGVASTGTISGNTIYVDNVSPGPHLFERVP